MPKRKSLAVVLVVLVLVVGGWYVYQQLTASTLYGTWRGTIFIKDIQLSPEFRALLPSSPEDGVRTLGLELTFVEAGNNNSQAPGPVTGRLTIDGELWSVDPDELSFVGILEFKPNGPVVTISAMAPEKNTDGLTPTVTLRAFWRGNKLGGHVFLIDSPNSPNTSEIDLEGEWEAEKVD